MNRFFIFSKQTHQRKKFLLFYFFLIGYSSLNHHSFAQSLTYQDALAMALQTGQFDQLSLTSQEISDARLETASRIPNPSIFYEEEGVGGRNDFDESTIGLSANLDFLFKRGSRVKSARLRNRISKLELETRKIKLAKELGEAFIDHSYFKREIKQLERSLERHKQTLDIAVELVGTGMLPKVSLQQIKFKIEDLDFNLRDFNDQNAQLLAGFRLLVGSMKAVPEDNEILVDALLTDSKSAVNTAWENRKDLLVQKEQLEWRKQEVHRLKRENFPDVTLEVASKQYATNENGTFWGISIELPLGETRGQGKIAKAEADQFVLKYEEFRRQVAREVASAWEAFNYWYGAKENSNNIDIQSRKDFLQTAKVRFQSGESGVLEYLDALDAHLNSIQKISLTELRKDKAYLNLISSCGRYLTFENSAK